MLIQENHIISLSKYTHFHFWKDPVNLTNILSASYLSTIPNLLVPFNLLSRNNMKRRSVFYFFIYWNSFWFQHFSIIYGPVFNYYSTEKFLKTKVNLLSDVFSLIEMNVWLRFIESHGFFYLTWKRLLDLHSFTKIKAHRRRSNDSYPL